MVNLTKLPGLLVGQYALAQATTPSTIDNGRFAKAGSDQHLKVVEFIKCQLEGIAGLKIRTGDFDLATWEPAGNSMYQSARLKLDDEKVDIVGAMAYTLPTNGSYVTAPLSIPPVPIELITSIAYHLSPIANDATTYARPYLAPVSPDLLAASLAGAAGFISPISAWRDQKEGYYTTHAGVHWLVSRVFTRADSHAKLLGTARTNGTASIRIDAETGTKRVPRFWAPLPGRSNETIVLATHSLSFPPIIPATAGTSFGRVKWMEAVAPQERKVVGTWP